MYVLYVHTCSATVPLIAAVRSRYLHTYLGQPKFARLRVQRKSTVNRYLSVRSSHCRADNPAQSPSHIAFHPHHVIPRYCVFYIAMGFYSVVVRRLHIFDESSSLRNPYGLP